MVLNQTWVSVYVVISETRYQYQYYIIISKCTEPLIWSSNIFDCFIHKSSSTGPEEQMNRMEAMRRARDKLQAEVDAAASAEAEKMKEVCLDFRMYQNLVVFVF